MSQKPSVFNLLSTMLKVGAPPERTRPQPTTITNVAGQELPDFADIDPADVQMITVEHPDGRMSQYPPPFRPAPLVDGGTEKFEFAAGSIKTFARFAIYDNTDGFAIFENAGRWINCEL